MKILSAETNLGSVTNVSNASVVRLFNSGDSNVLVTRKDYSGTTVGSFMVPAGDAVYAEKYYTDTLEASADVKASKTAYSSMMSFVGQTDSLPTYTLSVSATSVDEGGNFTTTVSTTNVDDGTQFNYVLSGTNVTSADFSSGSLNGTITISNNTASFSHTVAADTLTEGTETFTIKIYDASLNYVGNTLTVSINDTSLTPPPTYTPTINHTSRDEGDSFTTTMTTTNVANSTELFWELSGTGIAAGDFSSGALTGSGTISSNTFNFSHTIASDNTTEGTETLNIKFYSDSGRTTQVGSTLTCTINDTSLTPPTTYSVLFNQNAEDGDNTEFLYANSSDLAAGQETFQVECFFYPTNANSYNSIVGTRNTTGNEENGWTLGWWGSGLYLYSNGFHVSGGGTIALNQWHHAAFTYVNNNTMKIYLDGVLADTNSSISRNYTNQIFNIGKDGLDCTYGCQPFQGYISNVRFMKGSVTYTSNFTVPTSVLTATSQGANSSHVKLIALRNSNKYISTVGPNLTDGPEGGGTSSSLNPF